VVCEERSPACHGKRREPGRGGLPRGSPTADTVTTDGPGADAATPGADDVARRRRQAVLAGHRGDRRTAGVLAGDSDPGVRGAALGALARLGALDDVVLLGAFGDGDPTVRRRAGALAAETVDPGTAGAGLMEAMVELLDDPDPSVVETAAWAFGEFGRRCPAPGLSALCRVAAGHDSPLCREAAVAALGAIGVPDTLTVVLAALDDTVNIRRRAAIALAAFDDPSAEEGLRRCLTDRDWQVRQAAEELLGDE